MRGVGGDRPALLLTPLNMELKLVQDLKATTPGLQLDRGARGEGFTLRFPPR